MDGNDPSNSGMIVSRAKAKALVRDHAASLIADRNTRGVEARCGEGVVLSRTQGFDPGFGNDSLVRRSSGGGVEM